MASFLYIGVMHAETGHSLILRSKAAFTQALVRSPLIHQVVNPSGYFSDVSEFLAMARHGVIVLPPARSIRVAPIHGADLARFAINKLDGPSGAWDVGGPRSSQSSSPRG
ncbi:hypothetical protein [Acidipropionibacterium virtanenii]|uniref:Uncharacterized protein n=1 Tax=Acidipropionibacterium virtanenii TaxID=2057246 RepID=A0A344UQX0_9ACTN|nr:hypothetical protein [Acidipropionibacterium virtanenii]AXE37668.1 hypothetical protein JS278_00475 [Acidipropionibacterium virtanenii]